MLSPRPEAKRRENRVPTDPLVTDGVLHAKKVGEKRPLLLIERVQTACKGKPITLRLWEMATEARPAASGRGRGVVGGGPRR